MPIGCLCQRVFFSVSVGFFACPLPEADAGVSARSPVQAALPVQLPFFFLALAIYIIVSLSIGSILGLVVKNQAKLTMIAQLVFLPSIMLSGIMFPIDLLPDFLEAIGRIFPASWGYRLMLDNGFCLENLWYLILVFCAAVIICAILLNKQKSK